ncbi:MAG TPA: cation-transporting P-type ATPase [Actinomycetota bacterium]
MSQASPHGETAVRAGLSTEEARRRLEEHGPNELPEPEHEGPAARLLRQLREPMAILLLVAAGVAGIGLGERLDGIAIVAIVILNAVIGFVTEGRAQRALEALRSMETPRARVRRSGRVTTVPAREVVPGDVVLLSPGDRVPADLRLLDASGLEIDESMLTGESLPVAKEPGAEEAPDAGLGERPGSAHSGTLVSRGVGEGEVVATGADTALGEIGAQLGGPEQRTPLQDDLARLTKILGLVAVVVAAGVMALTLIRTGLSGESIQEAFLAAVALAVAAVPEGLATVVAIGLALGVRRMAEHGAIVRRLPAVETLGSTTVILTDKTGTLTQNRMRLAVVAAGDEEVRAVDDLPSVVADRVRRVATLCSDAELDPPEGDPIEVALLEAVGADEVERLREQHPRISQLAFDAERRRMTTAHRAGDGVLLLMKGAPEVVIERSTRLLEADGEEVALGDERRRRLVERAESLAGRGMRLLALADRGPMDLPDDLEDAERDLTLVGLAGLADPVRDEASDAVGEARQAGIDVLMVTGDHAGTAASVAREVDLRESGVVTGADLRRDGLPEDPRAVSVYARVDPGEKLRLVDALQGQGEIVAVTGDGVNDAPALQRAHIGVAMGRGSDVARESSDMVLTDDNLATIVRAVRQGRGIYDNIRKVVDYLIGGNLSEIAVVVGAFLLFPALGTPLLPLQLLWINLLTDGLPALALGADAPDPGLMRHPPRDPSAGILPLRKIGVLSVRGLLIATASIAGLALARFAWDGSWDRARGLMFTVLVIAHLWYAFVVRGRGVGLFSNPWLVSAVLSGIALQIGVVTWEPARDLFGIEALEARDWAAAAVLGVLPALAMMPFRRP